MYDPQLLKSVPSADDVTSKFSTFECRPLQSNDYNHGFISLLKQLTSVGSVSESDFQDRFNLMKNCKGTYYNTVIVDRSKSDQIIASATLIVEKKFIHSCANVSVIYSILTFCLHHSWIWWLHIEVLHPGWREPLVAYQYLLTAQILQQLCYVTYALSFYRSQNVLCQSKFFEPAQKFDCIQCLFKNFCAGTKTNFTECKASFCLAQNFCDCHNM